MYSVAQSKDSVKWTEKKRDSIKMAARFVTIGGKLFSRGKRMEMCGDIITSTLCPHCGTHGHTLTNLCRDRLCPICAWRLSRARFAQMAKVLQLLAPIITEKHAYCQLITLTVKNIPLHKLSAALKEMSKAWDKLARRQPLRDKSRRLIGWARNTEITINPRTREAHPHYHIMLLWDGEYKRDVMEWSKTLQEQWRECLGIDYNPIVDARAAYAKKQGFTASEEDATIAAALEASKYCVKDKQIAELSDSELVMFAHQIAGYRFASYGGMIKLMRQKLGLSDEDYNEMDDGQCTKCGAKMVQYIMQWNGASYVITDAKGVCDNA